MDYGNLNLASLILGFIAIMLPLTGKPFKTIPVKMFTSFSLCLIAVNCQLVYQNHLVHIQDWAAIEDTTGAVVVASTTLIVLTVFANLLCLMKMKKGGSRN